MHGPHPNPSSPAAGDPRGRDASPAPPALRGQQVQPHTQSLSKQSQKVQIKEHEPRAMA